MVTPPLTSSALRAKRIKRLALTLCLCAMSMFGFGYALVPLYNVLCKNLGFNGKTSGEASSPVSTVDLSRTITVQFLATNNENLPWKFRPNQVTIEVHPGENTRVSYYARNESGKTMTVQAVPSVTPGPAAKYLKKTECFCFRRQTLASHAEMDMPLIFHLDRDLPKNVNTVTLSYTLFDVTDKQKQKPPAEVGRIK
jgi:cytochrome c oxidase assembly protein subunit 11